MQFPSASGYEVGFDTAGARVPLRGQSLFACDYSEY